MSKTAKGKKNTNEFISLREKQYALALEAEATNGKNILSQTEIDELIISHLEKAEAIGWKLLRSWHVRLDVDEFKSVIGLSLSEAAIRFDPSKKVSFTTFLFYYLRGSLIKEISRSVKNSKESFKIGLPSSVLNKDSTDNTVIETNLKKNLGDDQSSPENVFYKAQLEQFFKAVCAELSDLEQDIVFRNLMDDIPLKDVAVELKLSRCYVSRTKRKALDKLQQIMSSNPLLMELLFDKSKSGEFDIAILKSSDDDEDSN